MEQKKIDLNKVLESYRCMSISSNDSWRKSLLNTKFSSIELLKCTDKEILNYVNRLDFPVCKLESIRNTNSNVDYTMRNIIDDIYTCRYKSSDKINTPAFVSSNNNKRNIGDKAYLYWNGFQAIDLDIKNKELSKIFKQVIFDSLKHYNWFIGVAISTSGNGLHVYTKIETPEEVKDDLLKSRLLYLSNYRHKYSFVYISLISKIKELGYTEENLIKWMDMSMFRPAQPLFITSDPDILISTNFFSDFIYVSFDNVEDMGHPDIDWISYTPLKQIFKRWEWFEEETTKPITVLDVGGDIDINTSPSHYKHFERWKLANTLVNLYGERQGYSYMRKICSGNTPDYELKGDCQTAARHNKPIDEWAVSILNKKHGFKIKIDKPQQDEDINELYNNIENINNPTQLISVNNNINLNINKDQYLGDIRDEILSNIGRITLIEAGAGVGKTEMVKSLSREGKRVMMVMPFTSTIKAKVEGNDDWIYAYGSKKINLAAQESMSLTVDKFSRLSNIEIASAQYDYIFIDESHLLFQSEYRSIMPKVIDIIRFSEVPIIMMSGTPVGELIFFPDATHIKVNKEDIREKVFNVIVTDDEESVFLDICRSMANDIANGRRVIFPTNKGTLYKEQLRVTVQYFLEEEYCCRFSDINPVIVNYYKKSNNGEQFMDSINKDRTIGDTDILLCSNYLSVGVDIEDKYTFSIYLNDLWMPQEIEQFANRLRSNNLYIYLYVSEIDSNGDNKYLFKYNDIDLRLSEEEMRTCHSILQLCNAAIERNPVEYKYNSLISTIIHNNKYVNYNDIENKYYLNETAYKVNMFERKYREYVCQLPVIIKGMVGYGYTYTARNKYRFTFNEKTNIDSITNIKKQARMKQRLSNMEDIDDLLDLMTDDRIILYKDVMSGKYEIKKGPKWRVELVDNNMIVKNIEVFEKVVPIVLSFSKMFTIDDIKSIFDYCKRDSGYNFTAIGRIKTLANIIYNNNKNRLDIPIKEFMERLYIFIECCEDGKCNKKEIETFIDVYVDEYARRESSKLIPIWMSKGALKEIRKSVERMVKCLADISRPNKTGIVNISKAELLWNEKNVITYNDEDDIFIREFILGNILNDAEFEVTTDIVDEEYNENTDIDEIIRSFNEQVKFTQLE